MNRMRQQSPETGCAGCRRREMRMGGRLLAVLSAGCLLSGFALDNPGSTAFDGPAPMEAMPDETRVVEPVLDAGETETLAPSEPVSRDLRLHDFSIERDPFRPVGYQLPSPGAPDDREAEQPAPAEPPVPVLDWPELRLRGFSRTPDGSLVAFLDGIGIVQAGDRVQLRRGDWVFSWLIESVSRQDLKYRREAIRRATSRDAPTRP